ncbi:flagellar biosynthetic protein FliO [Pseudohongiella spirulinae]|uniref:Flagellar protein n=1 Tax=Pseudohongiella spirulinae TaxID=1249552 RepID=A0A0S2KDE0_9GAMM|nr:flagellar biosynthetic protein FliO [Pseudohongiella spirulinae]ALO46331.1 Flagellar biosynthesis protein, FliO [Pseudohongiella spirulinae]
MSESGTAAVAETLLWLGVIVGLILALAWAARRFSAFKPMTGHNMKVVGALPVGSRERVVIVQVGERQMLLGVAPGSVNYLGDLGALGTEAVSVPRDGDRLRPQSIK